jgi:hypothetical protein
MVLVAGAQDYWDLHYFCSSLLRPGKRNSMIKHPLGRDFPVVAILAFSLTGQTAITSAEAESLNLTNARIVGVQDGTLAARAADILTDEIAKRNGIALPVQKTIAASGAPAILIQTVSGFDRSRLLCCLG